MKEYESNVVITTKVYSEKKKWVEQFFKGISLEKEFDFHKKKGVRMEQDCPNCPSKIMYFYTLQLRSADEGTTVFYECADCG